MSYRSSAPCPEWADKLARALRPGELTSSESAAFQDHITGCPACATSFRDYQDLVMRLRSLPRPATQPHILPDLFVSEDKQERGKNMDTNSVEEYKEQEVDDTAPPRLTFQPRKKIWRGRVTALAAVLLVALLVGSFAFLSRRTTDIGAGVFKLSQGWTPVALYQGTGSQVIPVKNIQLPLLWGYSYACQGSGALDIKLTGSATTIDTGTDKCNSREAISPTALSLTLASGSLQKIAVTVDASTGWSFQIVQEGKRGALPLNTSVWTQDVGFGGSGGSERIQGNVLPLSTNGGRTILPKTWGVLLVCIGNGHGSIQLDPDAGKINFPTCDGQVKLNVLHYPTETPVQQMQATVSGNMVWLALLIGWTSTDSVACK